MNKSAYTIPGFIRFAYKNSKPEIQKKFLITHIYILLTAIFDNAVSYSLIFIIQGINSSEIIRNDSIQNFIFLNKNIFLTLSLYLFFLIISALIRSKALLYSFKSAALLSTSSDYILLKKYILSKFEKASNISSSELLNLIINHSTALNYNLFYPYFMVLYSLIIIIFFSLVFIFNLTKLAIFILLLLYLIYFTLFKIERKKIFNLSENYSKASKKLSAKLVDTVKLFRETKLNQEEIELSQELNNIQKTVRISQAQVSFKGKMPKFIIEAIILFSLAILAYKSKIVNGNILENYKFQISLLCIGRLYPSFQSAYSNFSNMIASRANIRAYLDLYKTLSKDLNFLIDHKNESSKKISLLKKEPFFNQLKLSNISFSYKNNKRPIFENLSIMANKGERIFITGNSGSGKTTLINLIMGLLDPTNGDIFINNINKENFGYGDYQKYFSLVSQTPYLKHASIIENITGNSDTKNINKEFLNECLEISDCTSFINQLERGFFEIVGEGGLTLSGGQQQRLTIARALYKNKPILVLDEATNSLDLKSQKKILGNIIQSRSDTTILAICHDLSAREFFTVEWVVEKNKIQKNLIT